MNNLTINGALFRELAKANAIAKADGNETVTSLEICEACDMASDICQAVDKLIASEAIRKLVWHSPRRYDITNLIDQLSIVLDYFDNDGGLTFQFYEWEKLETRPADYD